MAQKKEKNILQRRKAGHRSWAAHNQPVSGEHRGDIMSPEARSRVMASIKNKETAPERIIIAALKELGLSFDQHVSDLPGRPDIVFHDAKLIVFIDGDFWHGWRFPLWKHKLTEYWRSKIAETRRRDQRNFSRLRRAGWMVLRIWEHQIEADPTKHIAKVVDAYNSRSV